MKNKNIVLHFSLFTAIFVFLFSFYKIFSKETDVFVKIKVNQGFWWATTNNPPFWYLKAFEKAIKNNEKEKDLSGKTISEIVDYEYYPSSIKNQYNIYLTLKLKAKKTKSKYYFKRSSIGVSSSIDLEFPSTQISGTIIDISENKIKNQYKEKVINLQSDTGNEDEYNQIKIGDKYFNGQEYVLEILEKEIIDENIISIYNNSKNDIEKNNNYIFKTGKKINLKIKAKVKNENNQLIFAEEQIVKPGNLLIFDTENFRFNDYYITRIENN